jgi:ubiquinone/menaquinone biosynthesis C-methylase UbiE
MKIPGQTREEKIAPVTRTHAEAQINYDRLSRWYDLIEGGWEGRPRRLALHLLAPKPGEQILEIGCGTGASLLELARAVGDQGRVSGLDLSPGMLLIAEKKLRRKGLLRRVELRKGDALHLPYQTASMDAIFMAFTLELFDTPEIPLVLAECRRVLKREGRLAAVSMSKLGGVGAMQRAYEWFHARFPRTIDCRPIYLRKALKQNGFSISKYRVLSLTGIGVEIVLARADP